MSLRGFPGFESLPLRPSHLVLARSHAIRIFQPRQDRKVAAVRKPPDVPWINLAFFIERIRVDYQVLALKWRPQRFEDVVGQDHVSHVIAGAIEQDRVANAYLFSGPRGCGKTTVARILAKALNCEQGPTREPCGECESCKSIAAGRSMAVLELDAASKGGIDDIRELRENLGYGSLEGRYRVIILDEAHQITGAAANAFLKTLEEPPPNVVFVLATTEYDKILATIRSRCQRYAFRLLRSEEIAGRIEHIAESESIELGEGVSMALGRKAEGSMRDGLTLFDQSVSSLGNKFELDALIDLLGLPRYEHYFDLTDAIIQRDGAAALKALDASLDAGGTPSDFVMGLAVHFRNLLVMHMNEQLLDGELPAEDLATCKRLAAEFKDEDLLYLTRLAGDRAEQIRRASQPRILAEAFVVELTRFEKRVLLSEVLAMLKASGGQGVSSPQSPVSSQKPPSSGGQRKASSGKRKVSSPQSPVSSQKAAEAAAAPKMAYALSRSGLEAAWPSFVGAVKQSSMIKGQFLDKARPGGVDRDAFTLHLDGHFRTLLDNHEDRLLLQDKFREIFGEGRTVRFMAPEDEAAPEAAAPRVSQSRADDARRERSLQEHSDNALVADLLKKFDGEIVEDR